MAPALNSTPDGIGANMVYPCPMWMEHIPGHKQNSLPLQEEHFNIRDARNVGSCYKSRERKGMVVPNVLDDPYETGFPHRRVDCVGSHFDPLKEYLIGERFEIDLRQSTLNDNSRKLWEKQDDSASEQSITKEMVTIFIASDQSVASVFTEFDGII